MNWHTLNTIEQLDLIDEQSLMQPVLLLKHSTRCSISIAALARLERGWDDTVAMMPYYLDLLSHRDVSNAIATRYGVEHQSPQVLIIQQGKCIYTESHMAIIADEILNQA